MKFQSNHNKAIFHKKFFTFFSIISFAALASVYFSVKNTVAVNAEILDREEITTSIKSDVSTSVQENFVDSSSSEDKSVANTGDGENVITEENSNTETTVNTANTAEVSQQVTGEANTGYNEASRNISIGGDAGVIRTGDATVNTTGIVNANNSTTGISGSGSGGTGGTDIANTGDDSSFSTSSTNNTTTLAGTDNRATIYQGADTSANTGHNVADRNISIGGTAGQIITGAASTKTSYLATANQSVVLIGGESTGNGPGSGATIITTGDRHSSRIRANEHTNTTVLNSNTAYLSQTCGVQGTCSADTGHNDASRNIARNGDAGVIRTGNARLDIVMMAALNSVNSYVQGNPGSGYNPLYVVNTGDDSNFDSEYDSSTNTQVATDNYANVNQSVNAYANTGYNTANRNISFGGNAGVIETGDAEINICLITDVNESKTEIAYGGIVPSPTPSINPSPSPTPSISPSPTPEPTSTPQPTATPKPSNGGDDNGRGGIDDNNNHNNNNNDDAEEPQHETAGGKNNNNGVGGLAGQVLAASDEIFPGTFAATGLNINWLGLLKTLIVLMIGYTLGSVRHALLGGKN